MKKMFWFMILFFILLFSIHPVSAYVINSSDDVALSGMGVIDFESTPMGQYDDALTIDGVTFTPGLTQIAMNNGDQWPVSAHLHITDYFGGVSGGYGNEPYTPPYNVSGQYLDNGDYSDHPGADQITISFASNVDAFGFSWGAADLEWTLSAYSSSDELLEAYSLPHWSATELLYVGIAHEGIAYAVLTNTHDDFTGWIDISPDWIMIDDFRPGPLSDTAPVPEPSTMFLLGAGLIGLAGNARKKLKK